MSKKSWFDSVCNFILLYKLRFIILAIVIILGVIIFNVQKDLDNEYRQYGYTGFFDNIKYDDWTKEVIPKDEISSYNNDNKFIVNSKGETVYFYQLKQKIEEYRNVQGQYAYLTDERKSKVEGVCDTLLRNFLNIDYEFKLCENMGAYEICLKSCIVNGKDRSGYCFGSSSDLESLVKEFVRGVYREQNGLEYKE